MIFVCPRILPERALLSSEIAGGGRQFMAEIAVFEGSKFFGMRPTGGFFPELKDMTVRVVIQNTESFFPPFDESFVLGAGDTIVVAATRAALTEGLKGEPEQFHPELGDDWERFETEDGSQRWQVGNQILAEAMVTPASRLVGQTLVQIGFRYRYHCVVLGIQRRSPDDRARVTDIRLEPGDVLLIQGRESDISALRGDPDILLVEWTASEMPAVHHATSTMAIFVGVIAAAALGIMPISIATLVGAGLMLATGVLNIRQATRAIDRTIVMMIAAALALGSALQATGGAEFLAGLMLGVVGDASPAVILSAFFLMVAVLANVISTKATAVLFTPIAVGIAHGRDCRWNRLLLPSCSPRTAPSHPRSATRPTCLSWRRATNRFVDFVRVGTPLLIVVWLVFTIVAPWYYGLS